jgi:hypothetical protein
MCGDVFLDKLSKRLACKKERENIFSVFAQDPIRTLAGTNVTLSTTQR